ncbi:hypothetical protein NEOKW01_0428 [Nematocida sp. AWRm80]|nr:hypothetical protein NEOKW01_0428 [Nematocida sp. AWRm80]
MIIILHITIHIIYHGTKKQEKALKRIVSYLKRNTKQKKSMLLLIRLSPITLFVLVAVIIFRSSTISRIPYTSLIDYTLFNFIAHIITVILLYLFNIILNPIVIKKIHQILNEDNLGSLEGILDREEDKPPAYNAIFTPPNTPDITTISFIPTSTISTSANTMTTSTISNSANIMTTSNTNANDSNDGVTS